MSGGFFNDLRGFTMPDSVWNQGPLPTSAAPPNSAVHINYGSTLLGDSMQPYAYGEPAHIADQAAMLNTPHKIQKVVPQLLLPDARDGRFELSHGVDDGDVAFVLRVNRNAGTIQQQNTFDRLQLGHVVEPFVNLATVNYLLAGVQRYWHDPTHVYWQQFMVDAEFEPPLSAARRGFGVRDALRFVNLVARPFGVCHGSEMQGGQHEGSNAPATFPVNFITSLAVSGRIENLVNLWRDSDIEAGRDLVLHLEWLPIAAVDGSVEYVLNHWQNGIARQRFDFVPPGPDGANRNMAWQLVPSVWSMQPPRSVHENYDWRENGYWHVARSQIMKAAEVTQKLQQDVGSVQKCYLDDSRLVRGSVLEVNFEPVWVQHRRVEPPADGVRFRAAVPAVAIPLRAPAPPFSVHATAPPIVHTHAQMSLHTGAAAEFASVDTGLDLLGADVHEAGAALLPEINNAVQLQPKKRSKKSVPEL